MRFAIYARRSTEEHQAASLDVQVAEARKWVEARGDAVADGHVYTDSGVSRAEFVKRPALIAMLNAAGAGVFDAVVMRDESRLGGDMHRVGLLLQDLADHGVALFYYFTDERVEADGLMARLIHTVRSFASELEREKIAGRTREHLARKAARGFNVGGRVFGYENVEVRAEGAERRDHVDYRVNDAEATVVREVFVRYAAGAGLREIAADLNARGVASPQAGRRGTRSWCPNAIREMLHRERYRGVLVWGREGKAYKHGTRVRVARDAGAWTTAVRADLRIVPEELWRAVRARFERQAAFTGKQGPGGAARYLLSGFARCGTCGGPIQAANSKSGERTIKVYGCAWHRNRGAAVCANTARRPVEAIDDAVVGWIDAHVLSEALVLATLAELRRRLTTRARDAADARPALEAEATQLRREVERCTRALATSDDPPAAIVGAIAEREKRLATIKAELAALAAAPAALAREVGALEDKARERLGDLRGLLRRNGGEARKAVEALLDGPLMFHPIRVDGRPRYRIEGPVSLGTLFTTDGDPNGT